MRGFFTLLIFTISFNAFSILEKVDNHRRLLKSWSLSIDAMRGNQGFYTFDRTINNKAAHYKIADLVVFSYPINEKLNRKSIYLTLLKTGKYRGLSGSKFGEALRFEGYDVDRNRQVVYFVSNDYENKRMLVSHATYRDSYGSVIAKETELISRLVHNITGKKNKTKKYSFLNLLISNAYAQNPCSQCNGNPICLLACSNATGGGGNTNTGSGSGVLGNSGNMGNTGGGNTNTGGGGFGGGFLPDFGGSGPGGGNSGGGFGFGGMDFSQLTGSLSDTANQMDILNQNITTQMGGLNSTLGNTNTQLGNMNTNWSNTNGQLGDLNNNWSNTNNILDQQLGDANANWADTNQQLGDMNTNWANTNGQLGDMNTNWANTNNILDQRSKEFMEMTEKESTAWREMMQTESKAWREMTDRNANRAMDLGEKLADPKHLFKMAAASAAGAVLGATAVNMAIGGAKAIIGFLVKWARGDFKKMKEEQILKEFNQAKKAWLENTKKMRGLEATIDQTLRSMELSKRFGIRNPDLMQKLKIQIKDYGLKLKAREEKAASLPEGSCDRQKVLEEAVKFEDEIAELKLLADIFNRADPLRQTCKLLRDSLRQLAEVEGLLQRARPNILKAERVVNNLVFEGQKDAIETMDDLRKNKMSRQVKNGQAEHLDFLEERNALDIQQLQSQSSRDCRQSFKRTQLNKKIKKVDIKKYCSGIMDIGAGDLFAHMFFVFSKL